MSKFDSSKIKFARLKSFDERSRLYPVRKLVRGLEPVSKLWECKKVLDQLNEGSCVGHGIAHDLISNPIPMLWVDHDYAVKIYELAKTLDEWPGCVDEATMCLSGRGWLGPHDLKIGDEILGFDLNLQGLRWAKVDNVHYHEKFPYRKYSHNQIEIAATQNHNWLVGNRNTLGPLSLARTDDLNTRHCVPRASICFDQPLIPTESDDFVEVVAWACTEGSFRPEWRRGNEITIVQKTHKSAVAKLMERLGVPRGFDRKDGTHSWSIAGELSSKIRKVCDDGKPSIRWLRTLTRKQLLLFIDTCMLGDGCQTDGSKWGRLNRFSFGQKPGAMLDSFLIACTLAGLPVSRSSESSPTRACESWTIRRSNITEVRKMEPSQEITDAVWCPQSELKTFVAKRKDSIFITGNSDYEGTSVLAGLKAINQNGLCTNWNWSFTHLDTQLGISHVAPGIAGTNWYTGMMEPDWNGFIHPTGWNEGGHCYLFVGINVENEYFTIHNSWGPGWGNNGQAKISFSDYEILRSKDGEMAFLVGETDIGGDEPEPPEPEPPEPEPDNPCTLTKTYLTLTNLGAKLLGSKRRFYSKKEGA